MGMCELHEEIEFCSSGSVSYFNLLVTKGTNRIVDICDST